VFALKRSPDSPDAAGSDQELIAAVLAGSEAAFAGLVDRYQDRVYRLVSRYTRDPGECEDLAQEVFLRVFRKLHTFQHESQFYTWVYRIAVNAANDLLAKAGRRRLRLVEDDATLDALGDPRGTGDAPEAPLERAELARVTRELLDELPEKFRTVLVLREFEDLSYNEMAEVLQCRLGTVESRLFRARQRFRDLLETRYPDLVPELSSVTRGSTGPGGKR
jgi:RNA polymerase sigma-70 factor (ECF subfamily)